MKKLLILGAALCSLSVAPARADDAAVLASFASVTDPDLITEVCRSVSQRIEPSFMAYYDHHTGRMHEYGNDRAMFAFVGCLRMSGGRFGDSNPE